MGKTTYLLLFVPLTLSSLFSQSTINADSLLIFKQADYDIISSSNLFADIDFYNSDEITLYRELSADEVTATNGVLKLINNTLYEYITLPELNVGRFYSTNGIYDIRISFDSRDPKKSLKFELQESNNSDKLFFLSFTLKSTTNEKTVSYAGHLYYLMYRENSFPYLLYDKINEKSEITVKDTLMSFPSRR